MNKKESRITKIPPRRPIQRRHTSPHRDFTRIPVQHIDVDTSKKLELQESYRKIQCSAKLSKGGERIIFETEELNKYQVEPVKKIKTLINGKVKSTKLTWITPIDIDFAKIQGIEPLERGEVSPRDIRQGRRFVCPSRPLSQQETEEYRDFGLIPLDKKKGDWTRGYEIHLDKTTIQQVIEKQKELNKKTGQNLNFTEVVRLMILEGLKASKED